MTQNQACSFVRLLTREAGFLELFTSESRPQRHTWQHSWLFLIFHRKRKKKTDQQLFLSELLCDGMFEKNKQKKKNEQVYFLRVVTEHVLHDKSASISNRCYIVVCGLALNWTKPLPGFIFKLSFYNVGPKCTNIITLIGFTCAQCIL